MRVGQCVWVRFWGVSAGLSTPGPANNGGGNVQVKLACLSGNGYVLRMCLPMPTYVYISLSPCVESTSSVLACARALA